MPFCVILPAQQGQPLFPNPLGSIIACTHKRFDRIGNQKIHIHSACGLLNADFRVAALTMQTY